MADETSTQRGESYGPLQWNAHASAELQDVIDAFNLKHLTDLKFSVTIADATHSDFPLIGCSSGFTHLTGYSLQEIIGRNCRFLLNGVPQKFIRDDVRRQARSFCIATRQNTDYEECSELLPQGISKEEICPSTLPKGELICVQMNARKDGELFRNMFYMKQVWLNGQAYIVGLQAELPDAVDETDSIKELQLKCQNAWYLLQHSMSSVEEMLSTQFWYSGTMRRQT
jgi:hypothetical protein